jgi:hypothetical protein
MDPAVPRPARALVPALLALAVGAALRVAGSRGDLWYDELWSLSHAARVERPLDVLLRPELQHDNNHWLNTLWLRALGPDAAPIAYRALAWSASILTLVVLGWIGRRRGPATGLLALALAAPSFLLVQYGSEARGYAGAVLFSLLGFALVDGDDGRGARWRVPTFWGTALLGLASHLTFLYGYAALLAWHPLRLLRRGKPRTALVRLALYHALPVLAFAVLYATSLRHMVIGGGPRYSIGEVVLETCGWLFGISRGSPWAVLAALAAAGVILAELVLRVRERDDTALLFAGAIVLAPASFLAVRTPEILYPRYFLVCVPYFLLLLASLLARAWRGGALVRLGAALVLAATLAGNAVPLAGLLSSGRGQYGAAVRFLARETSQDPIEIGVTGEHNLLLLQRHAAELEPARVLVFRDPGSPAPRPPGWILGESQDARFQPPRELDGPFGSRYSLASSFPFAGLSGLAWFVYRREDGTRDDARAR